MTQTTSPSFSAGSAAGPDAVEPNPERMCVCGGQYRFHVSTPTWTSCSHLPAKMPCACQRFTPRGAGLLNCAGCGVLARYSLVGRDPFCFSCVREGVATKVSKLWTDEEQRLSERAIR